MKPDEFEMANEERARRMKKRDTKETSRPSGRVWLAVLADIRARMEAQDHRASDNTNRQSFKWARWAIPALACVAITAAVLQFAPEEKQSDWTAVSTQRSGFSLPRNLTLDMSMTRISLTDIGMRLEGPIGGELPGVPEGVRQFALALSGTEKTNQVVYFDGTIALTNRPATRHATRSQVVVGVLIEGTLRIPGVETNSGVRQAYQRR